MSAIGLDLVSFLIRNYNSNYTLGRAFVLIFLLSIVLKK